MRKQTQAQLLKSNKRLRALLKAERLKWNEKCPVGHLIRHDVCELTACYITHLTPIDTPYFYRLQKSPTPLVGHDWLSDTLHVAPPVPRPTWWDLLLSRWKLKESA